MKQLVLHRTILAMTLVVGTSPSLGQVNSQGAYGKVIRIDRNAFKPNAGRITFSEKPLGTANPTYRPADYGGDAKGISVSFGGFFVGQGLGDASTCPGRGALTGCVAGRPSKPLAIDQAAPAAHIANDRSNPESPAMSGTPTHNGPISMIFEPNIAGVGLQGGFFNAVRSTSITAFDRAGNQIGGVLNLSEGFEYMALVTENGSETIAGLQFSIVGPEPAGFEIDNLSFARRGDLQDSVKPAGSGNEANRAGGGSSLGDLFKEKSNAPARNPRPTAGGSITDLFK